MFSKLVNHVPILLTIVFTITSQFLIKFHFSGTEIDLTREKLKFLFLAFFDIQVLVAILCTFLAGASWMVALSRFPLSYAFPFMALNFALVTIIEIAVFEQRFHSSLLFGNILIIVGLLFVVNSRF